MALLTDTALNDPLNRSLQDILNDLLDENPVSTTQLTLDQFLTLLEGNADASMGGASLQYDGENLNLRVADGSLQPVSPSPDATVTLGTNSDDILNGATGDNVVSGLLGDDSISGTDGNDVLDGGDGNDTVAGAAGTTRSPVGKATTSSTAVRATNSSRQGRAATRSPAATATIPSSAGMTARIWPT
jgi:Ca2+-binding RTX toxin-like protein